MKPKRSSQLHPPLVMHQCNNKPEQLPILQDTTTSLSATIMVTFIFLIMMIFQEELRLFTNQESGVNAFLTLQTETTLLQVLTMTQFMSIRFQRQEIIHSIGQSLLFIHQLLLVWIGQETRDFCVLLIKLMLKFSMMLKTHNKLVMEQQHQQMLLFGKLQHVSLVGKLWVFSHKELMVLISTVLMLMKTDHFLLLVMISEPFAYTNSQF